MDFSYPQFTPSFLFSFLLPRIVDALPDKEEQWKEGGAAYLG
jgi:hypothetical protein